VCTAGALRVAEADDGAKEDGAAVLVGAPKMERFGEVAENWGAACTSAKPFFVTCRFRLCRLLIEPRAMPMPADPAFKRTRVGATVESVAPFPTTTVFTPPPVGGTSDVT